MTADALFPLSRPVSVADLIRRERLDMTIKATAEERAALAEYLGIPEVRALAATLKLRAEPGRRFLLEGQVRAKLGRTCVVSLEPMEEELDVPLRLVFEDAAEAAEDEETDPFDEDMPEAVVDGTIDPGAAVCELVALEMTPYPRRPDAGPMEIQAETADSGRSDHPFAALAKLRDGKN